MSAVIESLDNLEVEMAKYLKDVERSGEAGDIGTVIRESSKLQMELHELSRRVQKKSVCIEDRSRNQ